MDLTNEERGFLDHYLLDRELAAKKAWERSVLDRFYRDLRQTRFIHDGFAVPLPHRRELDRRQITHQQQIILKILAARGTGSCSLAESRELHKTLEVLRQIADEWKEAYVESNELDDWLAHAASVAQVTNGIGVLPGYAPQSKAARSQFKRVDGWLFHAPAGVRFGCQASS